MTSTATLEDLKAAFCAGALTKPDFIQQAFAIHQLLFDYVGITRSTDITEINISPAGVCFTFGASALRFFAPPGEARVAPIEAINFNRYEALESRVMDLLSSHALQVLDIGANLGWHALRLAQRLPQAQVHAFEPLPVAYSYLQRNVALNNLGHRVHCFNYGCSNRSGSFTYYIAATNGTNASLTNVSAATNAREVLGMAITLDHWCNNFQVAPDFIKCDVEGAELLVFQGAEQTLSSHKPIVFTELLRKWCLPFGYHPNDLLAFFAQLGYVCYAIGSEKVRPIEAVNDATPETNYAFLHTHAHASQIQRLEALAAAALPASAS